MTHDPYRPPNLDTIADPVPDLPPRPRNVNIALILIGVGVLINLFRDLQHLQEPLFRTGIARAVAVAIVGYLLFGLLLHQLARGKGWPRLVLLIVTLALFARLCWNIGYLLRNMPDEWQLFVDPAYLIGRVLPTVLYLVALHLLYFSNGNWFRPRN